jgi:hypothetical protein
MEGFGPRLRLLKHRKEIAIVIGPQHRFSQENDRGRVFSEMRMPKHCRILRSQDPQCVGILNFDGMQMIEIAKGLNDGAMSWHKKLVVASSMTEEHVLRANHIRYERGFGAQALSGKAEAGVATGLEFLGSCKAIAPDNRTKNAKQMDHTEA